MNLIIVESPTKARTLSRFLGDEFIVESTMGHIKDLPKEKLSVDIENNFKPNYLIVEKKGDNIKKIKEAFRRTKKVYLATDPDREGEAIAQHLSEILKENKASTTKTQQLSRIVFHEITQSAVENAINNPRVIDSNLVDAQIARRVLDRLVGYKLSPLLWKKVRRGLSAGRVQSVTVRLIVEREREIKAFVPQEYWEIFAQLIEIGKDDQEDRSSFVVKLIKIDDKRAEIKKKDDADKALSGLRNSDYKIFDLRKREVKKSPYPPFTTSTMTQTAARTFGWSAKRTMFIAQRLYEEGLITYHRTDSTSLSNEAIDKVRRFIKNNFGEKYLPETPRFYKTKSKVAQEAHEAIRPTNINSKFQIQNSKFEKQGEMLYDLIWRRFVACQMGDSLYDETRIDVLALTQTEAKQSEYLLRASGQVMKFDGWRKVIPASKNEEPQLPDVKKDEPLQLIKVDAKQNFTEPPSRYSEASLIKKLEELGIGRPSTYAPIISTIQIRNYVEKDEGKFYPTPVGVAVNDFLLKYFTQVFDYGFSAEMEDDLDNVANGKRKWVLMMKDFYNPFEKRLLEVEANSKRIKIETEKLGKKCPKCGKGELVIRIGRFGKFVSCSRFPDCDHSEKYVKKLGMKCPECKKGEVIIKNTKTGRKFYGCSRYPECKWASWQKPTQNAITSS